MPKNKVNCRRLLKRKVRFTVAHNEQEEDTKSTTTEESATEQEAKQAAAVALATMTLTTPNETTPVAATTVAAMTKAAMNDAEAMTNEAMANEATNKATNEEMNEEMNKEMNKETNEATPNEAAPNGAAPNEAASVDEAEPNEAEPNEAEPNEAEPNEAEPNEAATIATTTGTSRPKRKASKAFIAKYLETYIISGKEDCIPPKKKDKKTAPKKKAQLIEKPRALTRGEIEKATKRKEENNAHHQAIVARAKENKLNRKCMKKQNKCKKRVNLPMTNFNYNFFKCTANCFMIEEWLLKEHKKAPLSEKMLKHMNDLKCNLKAQPWVEVAEVILKARHPELIPTAK